MTSGGQVLHGGIELELVLFGQRVEVHPGDAVGVDAVPARGGDGPLDDGQVLIGDDHVGVQLHLGTQTGTGGTGTEWVIKGEHTGGQLLDGDAAVLAGVVLGEEDIPVLPHHVDDHQSAGEVGGDLHAVGETTGDVLSDDQSVHHHLDVVLFVLLGFDLLAEVVDDAVQTDADVAGFTGVLENFQVLALLTPDDGGHDHDAGGLRQGHDLVDDLIHRLLFDLLAALGTVRGAHPGPEQSQVVVDLGNGAHGGAGVLAGGLLVDGDGGRQTVDIVHVGLLHLAQEHTGVGGQRLHVAALSLGVNGVKGQRGLARAGQARQHHQLVPGDGHIDVF